MNYFITDTHFFHGDEHKNHDIISKFDNRKSDWDTTLLKELHTKLQPHDTLYCLGDFCFGSTEQTKAILAQFPPCKKVLVLGNHEWKKTAHYLSQGWDEVSAFVKTKLGDKDVILTHEPINIEGYNVLCGHLHPQDTYKIYPNTMVLHSATLYDEQTLSQLWDKTQWQDLPIIIPNFRNITKLSQCRDFEQLVAMIHRNTLKVAQTPKKDGLHCYFSIGNVASGKSTYWKAFMTKHPDVVYLSADVERIAHPNWSNDLIWDGLYAKARTNLKSGKSIIMDNTSTTIKERQMLFDQLQDLGCHFHAVFFDTPSNVCKKRLEARNLTDYAHKIPISVADAYGARLTPVQEFEKQWLDDNQVVKYKAAEKER